MTAVLVTGGTGTFGRAVVDALLSKGSTRRVVVFSRDEQKQDAMRKSMPCDDRLRFFLGDVRDESRLRMAMRDINIVLHAAAMKIVPSCEYDPIECIKTNVVGAMNVISAAISSSSVEGVVALSTDKAAAPANLYGASKLSAERLFISANNLSGEGGPRFSVARYGNVSGSRGSVIPLWRALAEERKPLPITHEEMTRFWITVPDAVSFVLDAVVFQQGGEIFIPKMPSYRIVDLAAAICGGANFDRKIVGVRPGEKLHEDLITVHEAENATQNDHAYVICPPWLAPGLPLPKGFSLTSANNADRMSIDRIKERLPYVE